MLSPAVKYPFKRAVSSLITSDKPFNFHKEPCLYTHSPLGVLLSPWLLSVGKQRLWLSNWQSQLSASQSCLIQNLRITFMNHKKLCYLLHQQSKYAVLVSQPRKRGSTIFFFFCVICMKLGGKLGNKDRIKRWPRIVRNWFRRENNERVEKLCSFDSCLNAPRKENNLDVNPVGRTRWEGRKLTAKFN